MDIEQNLDQILCGLMRDIHKLLKLKLTKLNKELLQEMLLQEGKLFLKKSLLELENLLFIQVIQI